MRYRFVVGQTPRKDTRKKVQAYEARYLLALEKEGHRDEDEVLCAEEVTEEETTDKEQLAFCKGVRSKRDDIVVGD